MGGSRFPSQPSLSDSTGIDCRLLYSLQRFGLPLLLMNMSVEAL